MRSTPKTTTTPLLPHSLVLFLLTSTSYITLSHAAECAAPPLNLPYRPVSVVPGSVDFGIPFWIGSPWQLVALRPSLQLDNSFVGRWSGACVEGEDLGGGNETNGENSASRQRRRNRREIEEDQINLSPLRKRDDETNDETTTTTTSSPPPSELIANNDGNTTTSTIHHLHCAQLYTSSYNPSLSSTHSTNNTNLQLSDPYLKHRDYSSWHFISDRFLPADYLSAYTALHNAIPPSEVLSSGVTNPRFVLADADASFGGLGGSLLGLTPHSTVMEKLVEAKVAPSKSWSLGGEGLCLGCVDKSVETTGPTLTVPAKEISTEVVGGEEEEGDDLPCVLRVRVEALNWYRDKDGEGASLIEEAFDACVDPGVAFLVLPEGPRKAWMEAAEWDVRGEFADHVAITVNTTTTSAEGEEEDITEEEDDDEDDDDDANSATSSILNVKIEGGLDVNITIPSSSSTTPQNQQKEDLAIPLGTATWGAYTPQIPILGLPFTSSILLQWDSSAGHYLLSALSSPPASSPSPSSSPTPDLHSLGCSPFPPLPSSSSPSNSPGILVGTSLGGFIAGLAFAAAALFFYQRGQKGIARKYDALDSPDKEGLALGAVPPASSSGSAGGRVSSRMSGRSGEWSVMSGALSPPMGGSAGGGRARERIGPINAEPLLVGDEGAVYEAPDGEGVGGGNGDMGDGGGRGYERYRRFGEGR